MKIRKLIVILLALFVPASSFVACDTNGNQGRGGVTNQETQTSQKVTTQKARKEIGISAMVAAVLATLDDTKENTIGKALFEKTGVYLNSEIVVDSSGTGDMSKMQLAFASGDLPDIVYFYANQPEQFNIFQKLIKDGQLKDLKPYINDSTPNLKKIVDNPDIYRKVQMNSKTDPIYCVVQGYPETEKDIGWFEPAMTIWAREDWLKIVNIDAGSVKNADDLYNLLKAFKEKVPNVNGKPIIPTTLGENGAWWGELSKAIETAWFTYKDGKILTQHLEPLYIETMGWFAKLNSSGLMDKEAYTQKAIVFAEKVTTGRVGVFPSGIDAMITKYNPQLSKSVPGAKFVPLYNMLDQRQTGPDGKAEAGVWYTTPSLYSFTAVTKAAKDPEVIVKFFDFIASDEGQLLVNLGVEGVTWENIAGKPAMKKEVYDQWIGESKRSLISGHGLTRYNFAGNDKHYEISGGDEWNWQLENKNLDGYKYKQLVCKERRIGIEPDPVGFVTTMKEFNDMSIAVYNLITPIQNKALTAKNEQEGKILAKEIQSKAIELGLQKFLDTATEKYNAMKKEMESERK